MTVPDVDEARALFDRELEAAPPQRPSEQRVLLEALGVIRGH